MPEIWEPVAGYEGLYEVSNLGRIKGLKMGRVLAPRPMKSGYLLVNLCKNNSAKNYLIHRLVAKAFIPNPNNKPQVNHKNGIKGDNRVSNLEWVTQQENQLHCTYTLGKKFQGCPRLYRRVRCIETGVIYPNLSIASQLSGVQKSGIIANCRKYPGHATAGGYHWEYVGE